MQALQLAYPTGRPPAAGGPGDTLRFTLFPGGNARAVTGIAALEQMVIYVLLTSPGSIAWAPEIGGGLPQVLQRRMTQNAVRAAISEIAAGIVLVEGQIRASQAEVTLPTSEQLQELEILSIEFIKAQRRFHVRLAVHAADGNVRQLALTP